MTFVELYAFHVCYYVYIVQYLIQHLTAILYPIRRIVLSMKPLGQTTYLHTSLHWLRVPERIQFKIAVLTYRVLHGDAPRHLGLFTSTADVPGRRALRSAGTKRLVVLSVRQSTVGSRGNPVAAAQSWSSLPEHIVSAPTLQSFRRHLKTFLLHQFFCLQQFRGPCSVRPTDLDVGWTALDSSAQHDASVFLLFKFHGRLPQSHRVRNVLQSCAITNKQVSK